MRDIASGLISGALCGFLPLAAAFLAAKAHAQAVPDEPVPRARIVPLPDEYAPALAPGEVLVSGSVYEVQYAAPQSGCYAGSYSNSYNYQYRAPVAVQPAPPPAPYLGPVPSGPAVRSFPAWPGGRARGRVRQAVRVRSRYRSGPMVCGPGGCW